MEPNWIEPHGEQTTLALPKGAAPVCYDLLGKVLVGGGDIAVICAIGPTSTDGLTVYVQPFRPCHDPQMPPGENWRKVYDVIDLDQPFLNYRLTSPA